tara:strand:+ start:2520 stop:3779 length:1260 start_codon:yes stop_codon:yes gene_type:complete
MLSLMNEKINLVLRLILMAFPILIILGPFALNCFSIIFSIYAITNFKDFKKYSILSKKNIIIFFSFIILIFPFESIDFDNAFLKYLSFFRFVFMLFGVIIFLDKENKKNKILFKIYKSYVFILTIILVDVLVEYFSGYNLLGYSSEYIGRIASFTNDELIIGYISSFLILFSLVFIFKKTNNFNFFIVLSIFIIISFLIGERSNFIKLFFLIMTFVLIFFIYLKKIKFKKLLILASLILVLLISFFQVTKNTKPGKKFYNTFDNLIIVENNKLSINFKDEFYNSRHAYHYITAYKIFLEYPIFGIGINNFFLESTKEKYMIKSYGPASNHPHQIYLEIISEVGLTGLIYFVFVFFYPVYISIKSFKKNKNIFLISHLILHIFFIFPLLPTGSLFGTNYGIPFWFNLSILLYLSYTKSKI